MKRYVTSLLLTAAMLISMVVIPAGAAGEAVTLTAAKVSAAPETVTFADLNRGEWYYDAVISAVENGLFTGVSGDRFAPDMEMDRAMMVTVLSAMEFGVKGAPKAEPPFTDLTADWYKNAVAWAAENKITYGISATEFAPHMALTREQVAVFLYAYAQYIGHDVSVGENTNILSYHDALEMSAWAYPAMQWACGAGLIDGTPEGCLLPNTVATRAQVAAILNRFNELVSG